MRNGDAGKPISHLATSAPVGGGGGDDRAVLAANCYDDVIRVYERSTEVRLPSKLQPQQGYLAHKKSRTSL